MLEFMSGIFGFIYYVDGNGIYTHENFYWIYMVAYFCVITYMVYTIVKNVRKYQYNGIAFFISIVLFMHAIDEFRATDSKMPTVSIGYASYDPDTGNIRDTIEAADRMMYQYKEAHR